MVNFHPNLEIHNIKRLILDESFFFSFLFFGGGECNEQLFTIEFTNLDIKIHLITQFYI